MDGRPKLVRAEPPRTLCHLFTERPIYRPEETVQIKGYVRTYQGGALSYAKGGGTLVVSGPGGQEWRLPVTIDDTGNVYQKFDAATPATGDYLVKFEPEARRRKRKAQDGADDKARRGRQRGQCGAELLRRFSPSRRKPTACRPSRFCSTRRRRFRSKANSRSICWRAISPAACRRAAGQMAGEPVPLCLGAARPRGLFFSTDARFSSDGKFKSNRSLNARRARRRGSGEDHLRSLRRTDGAAAPLSDRGHRHRRRRRRGAQPHSVVALPAFVLGVKTPRYQQKPGPIDAQILAVDAKGAPLEGLEMTARLVKRNWSSTLQASDFSQGAAKYVTQVVDETIAERKVTSTKEAQKLDFEAKDAGVYLVELEASDKVGRRQKVSVDFFVGGDTPVTFARAPAQTAEVTTDKEAYAPGETATLIIQSPFQTARALAIVENPDGHFGVDWVDIANGFGRYRSRSATPDMPKLPVHFLIMRGRLQTPTPSPSAPFDQGKPVTIAATKWITVTPVKNIVTSRSTIRKKRGRAQEMEVSLKLTDDLGQPVAGEATFWMVDQAGALARQGAPARPLPAFIVERPEQDGGARHAQHGLRRHSARRGAGRRYGPRGMGRRQ